MSSSAIQRQPVEGVQTHPAALDARAVDALASARCADPFALLGPHQAPGGRVVRAFLPGALGVEALDAVEARTIAIFDLLDERGLFGALVPGERPYLLRTIWPDAAFIAEDPYAFWEMLPEEDLALFSAGCHPKLTDLLGAREMWVAETPGVRFSVWAPNAQAVSVVGDFNGWDRRRHPMRLRHRAGVWELFAPRIGAGERYKFAIVDRDGNELPLKADPMAFRTEAPPETASIVASALDHVWQDADWMQSSRAKTGA